MIFDRFWIFFLVPGNIILLKNSRISSTRGLFAFSDKKLILMRFWCQHASILGAKILQNRVLEASWGFTLAIMAAPEGLLERLRLILGRLEGILDRLGGILGRLEVSWSLLEIFHSCTRVARGWRRRGLLLGSFRIFLPS